LESGFGPKASRFFLEGRPSIASDQISLAVVMMERRPIHAGRQTFHFVTGTRPTHAGIDPYNFYIDRNSDDNVTTVG